MQETEHADPRGFPVAYKDFQFKNIVWFAKFGIMNYLDQVGMFAPATDILVLVFEAFKLMLVPSTQQIYSVLKNNYFGRFASRCLRN